MRIILAAERAVCGSLKSRKLLKRHTSQVRQLRIAVALASTYNRVPHEADVAQLVEQRIRNA